MSWLVVGGNGQLGKALSMVLIQRNLEFCSVGSNALDVRSESECMSFITKEKPSVVINASAWTDVDGAELDPNGAYAVNATGPLNLAQASKAVGAIFAHVSTDYVFSGESEAPWSENQDRQPVSEYGRSKAAGEQFVVAEYSKNSYIFRTAWLYSSWGKNFAKTMTRLALSSSDEVRVVSDQVGQPTNAIDLANQIVDSIVSKLPSGIYHATNSGSASWYEFAQEIFIAAGQSIERVVPITSLDFKRLAKRPAYSVLGHDGWKVAGSGGHEVPPMRDWRIALREIMPEIVAAVRAEG